MKYSKETNKNSLLNDRGIIRIKFFLMFGWFNKIIINRIKGSAIIKGFASTTIWSTLAKALSILVTLYCTNTLSQEEFGEFGYLKNTLELILVICAGNFTSLGIKFAAESITTKKSLKRLYYLVLFTLSVSIFVSIVTLIMPTAVMNGYFGNEIVVHYIRIIALLLPVFIIQPLISAILRGYKEFNKVGVYEVSVGLFFLLSVIVGVIFWGRDGAIYGLLLYHTVSSISGIVILYIYNKKYGYITRVVELKSEWKCITKMILPVFVMSFIDVPLQWYAQTEIARLGTYALVGSMTVIVQVRYVVQILPSFFYSSFTPFISIMYAEGNNDEYFRKFTQLSKVLLLLSLVLIPVLIFGGKLLLRLFNEVYVANFDAYAIAILAVPLHLFCAFYKLNMMVREHQTSIMVMTIIGGVLFLTFLYGFHYLGVNILIAFFLAEAVQYTFQVLFGHFIYAKDKRKS